MSTVLNGTWLQGAAPIGMDAGERSCMYVGLAVLHHHLEYGVEVTCPVCTGPHRVTLQPHRVLNTTPIASITTVLLAGTCECGAYLWAPGRTDVEPLDADDFLIGAPVNKKPTV